MPTLAVNPVALRPDSRAAGMCVRLRAPPSRHAVRDEHLGASHFQRLLHANPVRGNTLVICINQLRENINTFGFGDKYHSPGGKAIKHNATMRIEVLRTAWIYPGSEKTNPIGAKTKVKFIYF